MDAGVAGTPRCRAINDYVFEHIRAIKPDVLLVAGYFSQYDHEANWRYPGYLDALVEGARRLHRDGVRSIVVAGEVPTWAPVLPILVGRDLLETGERAGVLPRRRPAGFPRNRQGARRQGLGRGRRLRLAGGKLCGDDGCRRRVGPNLPEDMLAVDYGHYSVNGSIFAVKTILAPVIEAEIAKSRGQRR